MRIKSVCFSLMVAVLFTVPVAASDEAADFNLRSLDGKRLHLKALLEEGPVLLDFWATWCKPCVKAMPKLQKIYDEYKDCL